MPMKQALALYETWSAREPDFVTALDAQVQFPSRWGASGKVRTIWYASDKWRSDGAAQLYVHPYDAPPDFCEPWCPGLRAVETGPTPREIVQLGECIAVEVARDRGGDPYPVLPDGTLLCAAPDGRMLVLAHPHHGIVAAIVGPGQRVTERGVEG
jgi:hypothetical protein